MSDQTIYALVYWLICGVGITLSFGQFVAPCCKAIDTGYTKDEKRMLRSYLWSHRLVDVVNIICGPFAILICWKYYQFIYRKYSPILEVE